MPNVFTCSNVLTLFRPSEKTNTFENGLFIGNTCCCWWYCCWWCCRWFCCSCCCCGCNRTVPANNVGGCKRWSVASQTRTGAVKVNRLVLGGAIFPELKSRRHWECFHGKKLKGFVLPWSTTTDHSPEFPHPLVTWRNWRFCPSSVEQSSSSSTAGNLNLKPYF